MITASDRAGVPIGMTISSFNSVSLDAPLVLFSVDRRALSLPAMLDGEGYAVNLLSCPASAPMRQIGAVEERRISGSS